MANKPVQSILFSKTSAAIVRDKSYYYYHNNEEDNDVYSGNGDLDYYYPVDSFQPTSAHELTNGFDMGGANGDSSIWSAFGTGGYDNEPPLLEELGIHFDAIKAKSLDTLRNRYPQKGQQQEPSPSPSLSGSSSSGQEVSKDDDDDLVGPVMFLLVLGASLLLRGKVAFQSVYSLYLLGVFAIFCILNLMNTHPEGIAWSRTMSILGYSLLPMVFLSCIAIVLPCSNSSSSSSVFGLSLAGAVVVAWCTVISTSAFVRTLHMNEQRLLVAYPIGLFYTCFALMTVY